MCIDSFNAAEFLEFRECDLVEVASTVYAFEENFHALKVMKLLLINLSK